MNKAELIDAIATRTGLSKKDSKNVVDVLFDPVGGVIAQALKKGDKVAISGFGSFEVRSRAAREARNPRTGAVVKVPATKVPAFRAGKGLKDMVR